MRKLRFRLRTVMITIAFVALILTIVMQSVYLQRALIREAIYRAMAEQQRAEAEMRYLQAQAALERANQLLQEKASK
jgi:hypothetical protein